LDAGKAQPPFGTGRAIQAALASFTSTPPIVTLSDAQIARIRG